MGYKGPMLEPREELVIDCPVCANPITVFNDDEDSVNCKEPDCTGSVTPSFDMMPFQYEED